MKKIIIFTLIILSFSVPIFSKDHIGVTIAPEFSWSEVYINSNNSTKTGINLIVNIEGANYFKAASNFGIGYTLGVGFPLMAKHDGNALKDSDIPISVIPTVSARYKAAFSSLVSLELGAGFSLSHVSWKMTKDDSYKYFDANQIGIFIDTDLLFNVTDSLLIKLGIGVSTPIYDFVTYTEKNVFHIIDTRRYGFSVKPNLGVSYKY